MNLQSLEMREYTSSCRFQKQQKAAEAAEMIKCIQDQRTVFMILIFSGLRQRFPVGPHLRVRLTLSNDAQLLSQLLHLLLHVRNIQEAALQTGKGSACKVGAMHYMRNGGYKRQ